jgi:hypothetical protein
MTIDGMLDAADHATPGPWKCVGDGIFPEASLLSIARICNSHSAVAGVEAANGALMCGAHALAAEVRRLRERERVLVEALEYLVASLTYAGLDHDCWIAKARAALEAVKEP